MKRKIFENSILIITYYIKEKTFYTIFDIILIGDRMKKVILGILKWLVIILILLFISLFIFRFASQKLILAISKRDNEISEMINIKLGEKSQKVLIEGKNKTDPLLLILHGGPMVPYPFGNGSRGAFEELTNEYIVVNWDQYGTGNNEGEYYDLKVSDYVKMTEDLISYLKEKYPNNQLYVLGISWGTILGAYAVSDMPQNIDKYISYGTFTNLEVGFDYYRKELLERPLIEEDLISVKKIVRYSYENLLELQEIGYNYGFTLQGTDKADNFVYNSVLRTFISPDYTLSNAINIIKNIYNDKLKNSMLFADLNNTNVLDELEGVTVQSYIIQGKYDNLTPHYIINGIVKKNTNISYYELENSGHAMVKDDFNKMIEYIAKLKNS